MTVGELAVTSPAPSTSAARAAPALVLPEVAPRDPRKEAPVPRSTESIVSEVLAQSAAAPKAPPPAPAVVAASAAPPTFVPRGESAARVPAEVSAGYEALRSGDLDRARPAYQAALARDPRSLDGNLGIATIEARSGNRALAASHYRRALEVDPQNSTALAGLAGMADFARVEGMEARLSEDIARQPRSAPLHFALGNMFASQSRWHDAQAAYFEAYRLDPANADVAYNLAVSLDHLGQGRLAAEHYRRALEAARGQPATQFEAAQVQRRLAELADGGKP
jgi:tetratricopeptide (TPR) repeat protein